MMTANDRHETDATRPQRPGAIIRLLIIASTAPWRPETRLVEPVRARLLALKAAGWSVRQTYARNFLIWRSTVGASAISGVIVLPSHYIALDRDERSAIAIDMLAVAGAIASTSEIEGALGGAFPFEGYYCSGMAKVQQAVAHGWAIRTGSP